MKKEVFEDMQPSAAGGAKDKLEKQARQLAYDTKYKVKQALAAKSGGKADPATVSKMYMAQLSKSPAPSAVKALAKKKLLGEEYIDVKQMVRDSLVNAIVKEFTSTESEVIEEEEKKSKSGEQKFHIKVRDKKTGNTYHRYATRTKIAELRANPNIATVEMSHQGEAGTKKASKDYDGDGKVESSSKEHAGAVHNAIQRKKGGVPDGQDTRKEEVEFIDEGLRSAVKRLLGKKDAPAEKKPESRGEQLRKKYNVGPERSDTSAKRQILDRSRAKAERDKKEFGGSRYSKSVADKSAAAHDRYLKAGYSKYGANDARGKGNKARRRAAALQKNEFEWLVDSLISEGYDLSAYTVEQFYDFCGELLDEIHTQAHTPHEVPSKNLKGLVKKAVKRIDADVDGDVDTNDPKSTEMGEFIPSPDGKSKVKTKIQREEFSNWRGDLFEKKDDDEEKTIDVMKGKNTVKVMPSLGEEHGQVRYCPKCEKDETREECSYGTKYWDENSQPAKGEDYRGMTAKVNMVRNKMRAMGLKMSYEPEGEVVEEVKPEEDQQQSGPTADEKQMLAKKRQMLTKTQMLQKQKLNLQKQGKLPITTESAEDRLRDRRMERGGVDGNVDYRRPPARKATNAELGIKPGKTAVQKELEKKHGKGKSAMDIVRADIKAKHGKGAIK